MGVNITCSSDGNGTGCGYNIDDNTWSPLTYQQALQLSPACADPNDNHSSAHISSGGPVITPPPPPSGTPPPSLAPPPDPLKDIAEQVDQQTAQSAASMADGASGGQSALAKSATGVAELGANQSATIAALYCAQGANRVQKYPDAAAGDFSKCANYYNAAHSLVGNLNGYKPDGSLLDGAIAHDTLSELEKKTGLSSEEYLGKMLGAGGGRDSLLDLTDGKLPKDALSKAFTAADELKNTDDKFAVNLGGSGTAKGAGSALKQNLKGKLASTGEARTIASASTSAGPKFKGPENQFDGLDPLHDGIFAREEKEELSLFGVVHNKYTELRSRWAEARKLR
jgi:hypothetical protein